MYLQLHNADHKYHFMHSLHTSNSLRYLQLYICGLLFWVTQCVSAFAVWLIQLYIWPSLIWALMHLKFVLSGACVCTAHFLVCFHISDLQAPLTFFCTNNAKTLCRFTPLCFCGS